MAKELSYVIVTFYSIRKSWTGEILSRLISRIGVGLVRERMFAPGKEPVERYAAQIVANPEPCHRATQELIRNDVLRNFRVESVSENRREDPGAEKCIEIVYQGLKAAQKICELICPMDLSKALPGSIRRKFGKSMMVNAAHASDSPRSVPGGDRNHQNGRKSLQGADRAVSCRPARMRIIKPV